FVEPARPRTAQVSEEADVAVRRLKRRNPGKPPAHDLAFHPPSLGIEHFASPSFCRFLKNMQDEVASGFVLHAVVVFGARESMATLVSAITTPPQRSSPPGLGRELGAVFPALVRARNDCFIALDLDPGNLGLALGASFTTVALKEAHGHSPFWPDLWV